MKEQNLSSQSINISGGQISNVQIGGQAKVTQSQQGAADKSLTPNDVAKLLDELIHLLQTSNLTESNKARALRNIETTKDEIDADEPDKEFAASCLRRAIKVLMEANETVEAGTNLWVKAKPILAIVSPWLGIPKDFLV